MSEHRDESCLGEPVPTPAHPVGRLPSAGGSAGSPAHAGSGDPAYKMAAPGQPVGPVLSPGAPSAPGSPNAGSGDPAYKTAPDQPAPRRLRRLHRVWPDRDGNISYLLTLCVDGRARVLDNAETFQRLTAFLLDSPARYRWFPRRFVVMPDHLHLIAHQGLKPVRLGQWIKALKAVVGGLERRPGFAAGSGSGKTAGSGDARTGDAGSGDPAYRARPAEIVGRLPSAGAHGSAEITKRIRQQLETIATPDNLGPAFVPPAETRVFLLHLHEHFGVVATRLEPRDSRRQLEQQRDQLPGGEPQQQLAGQQEQQQRIPVRPPPSSNLTPGGVGADPAAILSCGDCEPQANSRQPPPGASSPAEPRENSGRPSTPMTFEL